MKKAFPIFAAVLACLSAHASFLDDSPSPWSLPAPSNPSLTVSWDPTPGATGYLVQICTTNAAQLWRYQTTNTAITVPVPGGFSYLVYVVAENTLYGHTALSATTAGAVTTARMPTNTVQFLRVGNAWNIMTLTASAGRLQSSPDLVYWQTVGPTPSNSPAMFSGTFAGNKFFRTATP